MAFEQLLAQRGHALVARLDDQKLFVVAHHPSFPAIDGVDAVDDVHARGETGLDQRVGESPRVEVDADGGQDEDGLQRARTASMTTSASCLPTARPTLRTWARSTNGSAI